MFARRTGDEVTDRLTAARIAHARRREVVEVLEHPQLLAQERWTSVGEHTEAILAWLDAPDPEATA